MNELKVNHLAILTCVVVIQVVLFLWYSLFSSFWGEGAMMGGGFGQNLYRLGPIVISVLTSIIGMYSLSWVFRRMAIDDWLSGMTAGLIIGIAFNVFSIFTIYSFSTEPVALSFIDGGANILIFTITGLILGAWTQPDDPRTMP